MDPVTQISDEIVEKALQAYHATDDFLVDKIRAALTAALAGHVVVPREPTQAMIDAATASTSGCGCADRDYDDDIRDHWRAMIDAAPQDSDTPVPGWRDIASAPKDGTSIDVWVGGEFPHRSTDVQWRVPTDSEWWVHGGDTIKTPDATWHDSFGPLGKHEQPTHWQSLPAPPVSRGE